MVRPRIATELTIRLKTDPALAARLTTSVIQSRVKLLASDYCRERDAVVYRLISERPSETEAWLLEGGFVSRRDTVVLVDLGDEFRTQQRLGRLLAAAGISVQYSYSSIDARGHTVEVFKTDDDAQALRLIQKHSFKHPALAGADDNGEWPHQLVVFNTQGEAA